MYSEKEIDLCVIATLRSEVLSKTLRSFSEKIKFSGYINIYLNLDMVPDTINKNEEIENIGKAMFDVYKTTDNFRIKHMSSKNTGNFSAAVKELWGKTDAEYVFNLEDDWEFISEIDLDKCVDMMENTGCRYIRFPKINAPHLNCLQKVALQPSLWGGEVVRALSKEMDTTKDPEKQLRNGVLNKTCDKILDYILVNRLVDYNNGQICCKDIGREWRQTRNLEKWNKNKSNCITWAQR